ncbi:MAG: hypothetical protein M1377_07530 [Deltaproteobacteria bacterium]|nr:hypothetical protein [Deltaproteobacteria bacterium]
MGRPVRILGTGSIVLRSGLPEETAAWSARVAEATERLGREGKRIRFIHRIEEIALLAAWEALRESRIAISSTEPEGVGIALGIDEGIDGIKARHCLAVQSDGPLGASPLVFPFTTQNAVTARVSIGLDLRGEMFTLCGGSLSGATALGVALNAVRRGGVTAMLAGGATSIERVFLDALAAAGVRDGGSERDGAGILVLAPEGEDSGSEGGRAPLLIGYGDAFGDRAVAYAVEACLEDAGVSPREIGLVWQASPDFPSDVFPPDPAGDVPAVFRSPHVDMYSASFPLAVAAVAKGQAAAWQGPALIVGADCIGAAAAALVRGAS